MDSYNVTSSFRNESNRKRSSQNLKLGSDVGRDLGFQTQTRFEQVILLDGFVQCPVYCNVTGP